jgi:methionyl-tRNA synthetase
MFITEKQLKTIQDENGHDIKVSEVSGHRVEWTHEENYMFKLSSFRSDLLYWLQDETRIVPFKYYKILRSWLNDEQSTSDISVSRPSSRIPWGIPIPSNPSQNVYVWLDALVNYLTVAGFPDLHTWPPSVQVVGKDILKFHGIYWPIFLIAAGLEPPRKLLVHSHWTVDDVKMSKSKNNVVNPFEKVKQYTVDGFRYFLLKQGVPHSDGNYTETKVVEMLNADLANNFGNLLNRCVGKTVNAKQIFPSFDEHEYEKLCRESDTLKTLSERVSNLAVDVSGHYNEFNFYRGIDSIMSVLHDCNKFFDECKPWDLRKNESNLPRLKCVIHVTLETLRICSIALLPIVPSISRKVFQKLNVAEEEIRWSAMKPTWLKASDRNNDCSLSSEQIILYGKLTK